MGQITNPAQVDILLTDVDRLTVSNSARGMSPSASHIIALGEGAGDNIGAAASQYILLGPGAGAGMNTAINMIVIGENALDSGLNSANASDSIAIGRQALHSWTSVLSGAPNIAIGAETAFNLVESYGMILIGHKAMQGPIGLQASRDSFHSIIMGIRAAEATGTTLPTYYNQQHSVVIGNFADRNNLSGTSVGSDRRRNVIAGYQASDGAYVAGASAYQENVIIGYQAHLNAFGDTSVIIGALASGTTTSSGAAGRMVVVGRNAKAQGANQARSVLIGADSVTGSSQSVCIGADSQAGNGGIGQVIIGYGAGGPNTQMGRGNIFLGSVARAGASTASGSERNILIGFGAGYDTFTGGADDMFIMESKDNGTNGTQRRMFWGSLATGNIIIGNSPTADLDLGNLGTNCLKIPNGSIGGANPTNGGYFYVSAGALHYVGSGGTDTVLAPA